MMSIPIRRSAHTFDLVIILECDNVDRMRAQDPCEVDIGKFPAMYHSMRIQGVLVAYATPEESIQISVMAGRQDVESIMKLLLRGWKFQPELGDQDGPYETLT